MQRACPDFLFLAHRIPFLRRIDPRNRLSQFGASLSAVQLGGGGAPNPAW